MEQGAHATTRRVMVDHLTLPVREFEASHGFYLSALAPLGFGIVEEAENEATFGAEDTYDVFSIVAPRATHPRPSRRPTIAWRPRVRRTPRVARRSSPCGARGRRGLPNPSRCSPGG
jgi:catechol 2,3-dioxygenase-like lactoylglutathione lyase family enzyme